MGNNDLPAEPYWEDAVYCYLSRRHRSAVADGDGAEAERLDGLIQDLVNQSMADELYRELDAEAKAERTRRKQDRKKQGRRPTTRDADAGRTASVNVADLKRRIFNPHVSRENVIKALESLPPAERKATIAGLPPGLRKKLESYLKGREH